MADQHIPYSHNWVPQHSSMDDFNDSEGENKYLDAVSFQQSGPNWSLDTASVENHYDSDEYEDSSSNTSAQASVNMSADSCNCAGSGIHHDPYIETTTSSITQPNCSGQPALPANQPQGHHGWPLSTPASIFEPATILDNGKEPMVWGMYGYAPNLRVKSPFRAITPGEAGFGIPASLHSENKVNVALPGAIRRDESAMMHSHTYNPPTKSPPTPLYSGTYRTPFPSSRRPGYLGFAQALIRSGMPYAETTTTATNPPNGFPASSGHTTGVRHQISPVDWKLSDNLRDRLKSPDDYPAYFKSVTETHPSLVQSYGTMPLTPMTTGDIIVDPEARERMKKHREEIRKLYAQQRATEERKTAENQGGFPHQIKTQEANKSEASGLGKYRNLKIQEMESRMVALNKAINEQMNATQKSKAICAEKLSEPDEKVGLRVPMMGNLLPGVQTRKPSPQSSQGKMTAVESEQKTRSSNDVGDMIQAKAEAEDALNLDPQDEKLYEDAVDYAEFEEQAMEKKAWLSW